MAHPHDKISEEDGPPAHLMKPGLDPGQSFRRDPEEMAVSVEQQEAGAAPQAVTHRNAAISADDGGGRSGQGVEVALEDQVTGEHQDYFVGYGQAHDPHHQQQKNSQIAVMGEKMGDAFQCAILLLEGVNNLRLTVENA